MGCRPMANRQLPLGFPGKQHLRKQLPKRRRRREAQARPDRLRTHRPPGSWR